MHDDDKPLNPDDDKRVVLLRFFRAVHGGVGAEGRMLDYLSGLQSTPIEELRPACELLLETWKGPRAPSPGHVRAAAAKFEGKSSEDIRTELAWQRMSYAKDNMMNPRRVRAELARVRDIPLPTDDFECRVETKRRASLERILANWEGRPVVPRVAARKRGEGGLTSMSEFVDAGVSMNSNEEGRQREQ